MEERGEEGRREAGRGGEMKRRWRKRGRKERQRGNQAAFSQKFPHDFLKI